MRKYRQLARAYVEGLSTLLCINGKTTLSGIAKCKCGVILQPR